METMLLMKIFIRFFDIIISLIILITLSPLFLIISLILKLTGEGEVFFLQDRIGYNFKKFKIIKFATMKKNSASIGTREITIKDDPRVLPFGKFLRKYKLNELLQFINVFKGEMTIVGYRPLVESQANYYLEHGFQEIFIHKPGITSLASIFFIDEDKHVSENSYTKDYFKIIMPMKSNLEMSFYKQYSIIEYFKIIIFTIIVILSFNKDILFKFYPFLKEFKNYG